tara:strand:- start:146 stop:547 length:402 start_codon:yes stop_codon:yes gene_type:complete
MKVKVYRNLKQNCFSVMDYKTRKVIRHCYGDINKHGDHIRLENAYFSVSQKTRDRVVKERKKYVHAFVIGDWIDHWTLKEDFENVHYNPYEHNTFYTLGWRNSKIDVPSSWRGTVHLTRDSIDNNLKVWKERK